MELGLEGRVAIVTGGSKGIGKAIAEEMAAEGARLVICARGKDMLEKAAAEIHEKTEAEVFPVAADLSGLEGVRTLVSEAVSRFGRVDILVNNAGSIRAGSILNKPDEDWAEDWSLKVFGYLRLAREVIPLMKEQGGGTHSQHHRHRRSATYGGVYSRWRRQRRPYEHDQGPGL